MTKKIYHCLLVLLPCLFFFSIAPMLPANAADPDEAFLDHTPRILFVGNSFTSYNHLPEIFHSLCEAAGHSVEVSSVTKGGYYLKSHADPEDPVGAKVHKRLSNYTWDYVILQEQSTSPVDAPEASLFPASRILDEQIRASGGKTVFYMTWGFELDDPFLIDGILRPVTIPEMQERIADSYFSIGNELDAIVAPVGINFMRCLELYPEISMWRPDKRHPSAEGSYLAACTLFASIFDQSPLGLPFHADLEEDTVTKLQKIADRRLTLEAANIKLELGSTRTIAAYLQSSPENDSVSDPAFNEIVWSSSDASIVSVDSATGELTAYRPGKAQISAATADGLIDKCLVSVEISASSLALSDTEKNLTIGDSFTLSYFFAPENATDTFSFVSSAPDIAAVDTNGTVTAHKPGTAQITVSGSNGVSAVCSINVFLKAPSALKAVRATLKTKDSKTTNIKLTWNASPEAAGYVIYRSTSKNGSYKKVADTSSLKYIDKGLTVAKKYFYKIIAKAKKTRYNSAMSPAVKIRVPAAPKLKAKKGKNDRALLSWKKVKYSSGYEIYRSVKKKKGYKLIKTFPKGNRVKFTDKTRKKKKTHYYKMRTYIVIGGRKIYSKYSEIAKL